MMLSFNRLLSTNYTFTTCLRLKSQPHISSHYRNVPPYKRCVSSVKPNESSSPRKSNFETFREKLVHGPNFDDFLCNNSNETIIKQNNISAEITNDIPYLHKSLFKGQRRRVYLETYGCQMNVNDTDIVWSILEKEDFERSFDIKNCDVAFLMTCSIREGAETKIWKRLEYLNFLKKKRKRNSMKIGILGCMAERLKTKILEQSKAVDIVCGPDAYRDLPHLLAVSYEGQTAVNVLLSLEETYADIMPVHINNTSKSAFVSIMRGCDNMCSYCIVPFTRGRERSRPVDSILEEIRILSDQGIKEVTLLGQNVNSYRDLSTWQSGVDLNPTQMASGFKTVYKSKKGGLRFADLLDKVASINPEMRIRFTSPHPKDFPDSVLQLIKEKPNICKQIHLPAQSGNNFILEQMRRGYTREAYLDLVHHVRHVIPDISLSSDFIAGFCGETEAAHRDTVSLMKEVCYNFAFTFPYSMRQKTRAHHRLIDDVPSEIKARRQAELAETFRKGALELNTQQIGQLQIVLISGTSKRSQLDLAGRNDGNTKVIVPQTKIPISEEAEPTRTIEVGDYIVVRITGASSQVLKGEPLYHTTLVNFSRKQTPKRIQYCHS
ncbi:mitochondrial tRNA methylthiotransferase CDK5RAP1-like [Octopus vulgaris]|uniref:Mitochondrial tRNA methylthiotransferase CDK5RAP1-like n=1 Tax=Octopus vulgaris TaxID=6645 RepID=A0AA36FI09_OCTVU|nr:mitochondrial tRNA methylthiotransferase CDK5RAP1-like [Octopus vulgaris]